MSFSCTTEAACQQLVALQKSLVLDMIAVTVVIVIAVVLINDYLMRGDLND